MRRSLSAWRRAFVFWLCLAPVACSSTTSAGTAPLPLATTTTAVVVTTNLRLVLFDQVPASYVEEQESFDLEGPLDLAGAAKAQSNDTVAAQMYLERSGFQRGYQRAWVPKGVVRTLVLRVLLLGSPKKALDYFNTVTFADETSLNLKKFPTPDLAGSKGFTNSFTNENGVRVEQFVDLVRGPLFFHLSLIGPAGAVVTGDILSIAGSQSVKAISMGFA